MIIEDNISAPLDDAKTPIGKDVLDKFKLDRVTGEALKLPYNFDDIKLNPNTILTSRAFNECVDRLYHNMIYIDAHSKILPSNFPEVQKRWFGQINIGSSKINYLNSPATAPEYVPSAAVNTMVDKVSCATWFTISNDQYGIFGNTDSLVIIKYAADVSNSVTVLHNSNSIDSGPRGDSFDSNYFSFKNITNVIVSENLLYVCDSGLNKIFKYDITGLLGNNPATKKRGKVLLKQIGGTGTDNDKVKFNSCINIRRASDGSIYVLDYNSAGNSCIKKLDKDLNWEATYKKPIEFKTNIPVDFEIDKVTGNIFILSTTGVVSIFSPALVPIKSVKNPYVLDTNEKYINIFKSTINDEVIYIATTKNIFKRFKNRLAHTIGVFMNIRGNIGSGSGVNNLISADETIKFATAGNVRASVAAEEVYVGVELTKSSDFIYTVPRRPACWGLNHKGQLNIPEEIINDHLEPFSIHAGFNNTIANVPPGKLIAWGDNTYNQISDMPLTLRYGDVGGVRVEDVGVGLKHIVAVLNDGTVKAWGDNRYGQIDVPTSFTDGTIKAVACDAGEYHTMVVSDGGKVYGWGLNDQGQVTGVATTTAPYKASTFEDLPYDEDYIPFHEEYNLSESSPVSAEDVVCGFNHNFIIDANNNKVIGWGSNQFKQTNFHGNSGASEVQIPFHVTDPSDDTIDIVATQVDGGYGHSLALTGTWPDNRVVGWGLNNLGQVNGIAKTDSLTSVNAVQINGIAPGESSSSTHTLSAMSAIATGGFHNLAVFTTAELSATVSALSAEANNQVLSWGSNIFLQKTIPYNLYKTGVDLSQIFFLNLLGDPTTDDDVNDPQTTGNTVYDATSTTQVGMYFNSLSNVDVNKIDAGFGHSAVISRALPSHANPNYIYEFEVGNLYKTIIYDRYRESCYSLKQLRVKKDEFMSSWVINKNLTKLIFNHTLLYNNVHSQFTFVRDASGVPVFVDTQFVTKSPKKFKNLSFDLPNNYFVGTNEVLVTETFNRPLRELYEMQVDLLSMCKDHYIDVYPRKDHSLDISTSKYIKQ